MSEPMVPPTPPHGGHTAESPPPPPAGESGNRQLMLVLSYLWVLALIPYLTEQRDTEVKWHARHGLVLMIAEIILYVALFILSLIPVIGCAISVLWFLVGIGILVLHVICIIKAVGGQRFTIPYVSPYADQIP